MPISEINSNQTSTPSKTILTVLLQEGLLDNEAVAQIPALPSNAAIEDFLLSHKLVSADVILQAYAKLYSLPYIHLDTKTIPPDVLTLIPEITARRYDIVAYDKKKDILFVAITTPKRLAGNDSHGLLHELQRKLKVKIAPAFASLEDIRRAHALYGKTNSTPPLNSKAAAGSSPKDEANPPDGQGEWPVVVLTGQTIDKTILHKFPREVILKYQVVPFEESRPGLLSVAAVRPDDPTIKQLIAWVQRQNGLQIKLVRTDAASFRAALAQYDGVTPDQAVTSQPNSSAQTIPITKSAAPQTAAAEAPAQPPKPAPVSLVKSGPAPTSAKAVSPTQQSSVLTITMAEIATQPDQPVPLVVPSDAEKENQATWTDPTTGRSENSLDTFLGKPITTTEELADIVRSGNVPKVVGGIVAYAALSRASDIHIETDKETVRLRYRIDGELIDVLVMPKIIHAPIVSRIKILSQLKIDENRIPQDGRFNVVFQGREIDLRVSTLPAIHGEKVVMRILDKSTGVMSLADMGMDADNLKRIEKAEKKPYGIILATGPTGAGKSTTLYAILHEISTPDVNVITLEDPVEYEIKGINQTQIKPKIGFTFAEGLRSILRQDPDIIMVGEIRDKETAEMATHAALTGHLVLSTLHTNTASGALPRLINMGIEPFLITSSIDAIIGQRLVRRICPDCKEEEKVPEPVIEEIRKELEPANIDDTLKTPINWHFMRGKGCPNCNNGYRGRIGIFEVLTMSEKLEEMGVQKEPSSAIEQQAIKEGMITMKQDGLVKAIKGLTTIEEVMKATTE